MFCCCRSRETAKDSLSTSRETRADSQSLDEPLVPLDRLEMTAPTCPRCALPLDEPDESSVDHRCPLHGVVAPVHSFQLPTPLLARQTALDSRLPLWLPWPLPHAWVVSGIGYAGNTPTDARASLVACSGPSPVGGPADLLLIAEEPGVGLGARFSGLDRSDAGEEIGDGPSDVKPHVGGHPTPLWCVRRAPAGRAVYAGEADGRWLWLIFYPETAGMLTVEPITLEDLRDLGHEVDLMPFGDLCPRLAD